MISGKDIIANIESEIFILFTSDWTLYSLYSQQMNKEFCLQLLGLTNRTREGWKTSAEMCI